jgi:hypothetical protein
MRWDPLSSDHSNSPHFFSKRCCCTNLFGGAPRVYTRVRGPRWTRLVSSLTRIFFTKAQQWIIWCRSIYNCEHRGLRTVFICLLRGLLVHQVCASLRYLSHPLYHYEYGATRIVTGRLGSNRMVGHFVVSYPTSFSAYTLRRPRYAPYFVGKAGLPPDHFPKALAVAAMIPNFVGALAGVGFLTGFWMVRS